MCLQKNNNRSRFITPEFDTPPPAWFFEPKSRSSFNYSGRYESINVFVHIVREANGNGFDKAQVSSKIIDWLNYYYKNAHIGFRLVGEEYIDFYQQP